MKKVVYKDKWVTIENHSARLRGKGIKFDRYLMQNVAVVLPIFDNGDVLLEKQFRHALEKYLIEVPAGHIEKGEDPIEAAKREFEEETGYTASKMKLMYKDYQHPGVSSRMFYYFCATGLKKEGKKKFDDTELIHTLRIKKSKLELMLKKNKIFDHKTIEGYLYYKTFFAKK